MRAQQAELPTPNFQGPTTKGQLPPAKAQANRPGVWIWALVVGSWQLEIWELRPGSREFDYLSDSMMLSSASRPGRTRSIGSVASGSSTRFNSVVKSCLAGSM